MSERTSRSVRSVDTTRLASAASSLVTIAAAMGKLRHLLGAAARDSFWSSADDLKIPRTLIPACHIAAMKASPGHLTLRDNLGLSEMQAVKLATILDLASKPYVVEPVAVERHIQALHMAATVVDAERKAAALTAAVQASHDEIFVNNLMKACSEAAVEIGFPTVELAERSAGVIHIVAEEPSGRALVTEIRTVPGKVPHIASEVVGVSDSSCMAIIDAFDKALASRGVALSGHQRRFTGGVPELEVAREFIRNKVRRALARRPEAAERAKLNRMRPRARTRIRLRQG